MQSEIATQADFSEIRYAQCWEDADVLLKALDIQPGQVCLSIASGGDNTLALLSRSPGRVHALDLSASQLACLELRVAAFGTLQHAEVLELLGSTASAQRLALYQRCRKQLSAPVRVFWDHHPADLVRGIGSAGKFERYFELFRRRVLPLVHPRRRVARLLAGGSRQERDAFYQNRWDTWRWRLLFRVFFSRFVMGRLGRDPSFFQYVQGDVAERILQRARYALTALNPADNPYLQWILTGRHTTALPYSLRAENFEAIRAHLDRLDWRCASLESFLEEMGSDSIDRFNLSDVFEYMSPENHQRLLGQLVRAGRPGARLAYWNMLAPRSRPDSMAAQLRPLDTLARSLHSTDKAFFYRAFIIEEVMK